MTTAQTVGVVEVPRVLLRSKEAAQFLGIPEATLRTLRTNGDGPQFRKVGALVYYHTDDLTAWVMERPAYRSTAEVKES